MHAQNGPRRVGGREGGEEADAPAQGRAYDSDLHTQICRLFVVLCCAVIPCIN